MSTPLASKTTVSSRSKMAAPGTIGQAATRLNHHHPNNKNPPPNLTNARLPSRTTIKPLVTRSERPIAHLAATSSRIALPRSRLSGNTSNNETASLMAKPPTRISATLASRTQFNNTSSRQTSQLGGRIGTNNAAPNSGPNNVVSSFANSRSSSKVSSISSSVTRQSSMTSAQATARKQPTTESASSNYIPDTNTIRKGLAKFSNPIECQRQFQALNSRIRQLTEINDNRAKKIDGLQEQLQRSLDSGVGYATVVQYFAKKLKIDSNPDLETECEQLKSRVKTLMVNESEYENKLDAIINDYKNHLQVEQDLRDTLKSEFDAAKESHSKKLDALKEAHTIELDARDEVHQNIRSELEDRIATLETDLTAKTKDLTELRKEYETLNTNYNKLEESLTKDKDARVKYAQEKINQLQKDVESLNSVLEMRTERVHVLEKDSILLGEIQSELTISHDQNKALKQQLESLQAALENKRVQFENLLADHEKISQELKRERKERRRMTMRTEQLEFVLNESCVTDNNVTVLDSSVET